MKQKRGAKANGWWGWGYFPYGGRNLHRNLCKGAICWSIRYRRLYRSLLESLIISHIAATEPNSQMVEMMANWSYLGYWGHDCRTMGHEWFWNAGTTFHRQYPAHTDLAKEKYRKWTGSFLQSIMIRTAHLSWWRREIEGSTGTRFGMKASIKKMNV